jgi:hypothetical protein
MSLVSKIVKYVCIRVCTNKPSIHSPQIQYIAVNKYAEKYIGIYPQSVPISASQKKRASRMGNVHTSIMNRCSSEMRTHSIRKHVLQCSIISLDPCSKGPQNRYGCYMTNGVQAFSLPWAAFNTSRVHMQFAVDKVETRQVFLRISVFIILPILHPHLSPYRSYALRPTSKFLYPQLRPRLWYNNLPLPE